MAGRRQEPRLRDVGVLGGALGPRQFRIQPGEFLGPIAHALFQGRIGAFQRLGRLEARRDIGKGDDEAAAGHPVGAHLDHHMTVRQPFQIRLALGGVGDQPVFQQRGAVVRGGRTGAAHEFKDLAQWNPDLHEMRRQRKQLGELPVRTDQLQVRIEHRDTLPHMVQRGLQDLAVEMQGSVGIVEQLERRLGRDGALAQQQRHHQARGRSADRGRDQMLGMLQQFEIGRRGRLEMGMMGDGESLERMAGALGAEILRDRILNVLHGHRGAPTPERRCDRCQRVRHEQVGLQSFDRGRPRPSDSAT